MLATLRTRWAAKLAWFILGGTALHFVPGMFIIALIFAALSLIFFYHRATAGEGTVRQASKHLFDLARSTTEPSAETTRPTARQVRTSKRGSSKPVKTTAVDSSRYIEAAAMPVDPDYDDGYRCSEHGLNHDCPLEAH